MKTLAVRKRDWREELMLEEMGHREGKCWSLVTNKAVPELGWLVEGPAGSQK